MDNKTMTQTSNTEMVTISRAEYEKLQSQSQAQAERISALENQLELLMEAIRLSQKKQFGPSSEKTSEENVSVKCNKAEKRSENLRFSALLHLGI